MRDVIIVGGGFAGLSAAIYLGRALRDTLLIDAGHSMGVWEPLVENYLGFPDGISGTDLLCHGKAQARQFGVELLVDEVLSAERHDDCFQVVGRKGSHAARRLLLATGIFHIPPDIPGVADCLGNSLFFCKDCDGYRVRGQRIGILGHGDIAVDYALAMIAYTPNIVVLTNAEEPVWDENRARLLEEHEIPILGGRIVALEHEAGAIRSVGFEGGRRIAVDSLFTLRGDFYHIELARRLGAELDAAGQVVVDGSLQTTVPGLYAAGCVTPANCQMIIAAGQGATAAQAINWDLFDDDLETGALKRLRAAQRREASIVPEILD